MKRGISKLGLGCLLLGIACSGAISGFVLTPATAGVRPALTQTEGDTEESGRTNMALRPRARRREMARRLMAEKKDATASESGGGATNEGLAADPPRFHPREPSEWQGMLVELNMQAECSAVDGCGLAMACKQGQCGPCEVDAECAAGEACALDHCVQADAMGCRSAGDCPEGELCVLSGYAPGLRGNDGMTAACLPDSGGVEQAEPTEKVAPAPYIAPPFEPQELLEEVLTEYR